jgi:peptide deformylase
MAVKEIVKLGHPALKAKSKEVLEIDKEILMLIKDLKDTLYNTTGIGLAAPQIAVNKRVIFIDLRDDTEPILLINPRISRKFGVRESEEGCLSYPGFYGILERPKKVIVKGLNENGEEVKYIADELLCIAFCHEIDHLNGIMYTDRAYEINKELEEEEE